MQKPEINCKETIREFGETKRLMSDFVDYLKVDGSVDLGVLRKLVEDLESQIIKLSESLWVDATLEVKYTYVDPKTNKNGNPETITLDIEQKTTEFIDFYKKTSVNLPPDFGESVQDIWSRNIEGIQEAIEQNGFDEVLIMPAGLDIGDLSKKMTMENGYFDWVKSSSKVKSLDGIPFTNTNTDKPHIILVHKDRAQNLKDRPELAKTLNVKGQDVDLENTLSLQEYLIFQKKYFEETGKHLDEESWTWLATKAGARLVGSRWDPGSGRGGLRVDAYGLGFQSTYLGARPSRSFF